MDLSVHKTNPLWPWHLMATPPPPHAVILASDISFMAVLSMSTVQLAHGSLLLLYFYETSLQDND